MKRRHLLSALAVIAAAAVPMSSANAQEEIKLTVISGHPPVSIAVSHVRDMLLPNIDKRLAAAGKYKITWTQAYAGTVAKPPGVLKAIEDGVADMGHTPHLFNADKLPLEQITYIAPFGPDDPLMVAAIIKKLHQRVPEMGAAVAKHKQMVLAVLPTDRYHIVAKRPLAEVEDLKGVKLGTGGPAAAWIKNTGAIAVSSNLTQYYNSVQTGVFEGMIVFETSVRDYKFFEVAPYINTVGYGAMHASMLTFNTTRWKTLPKEVQDAIMTEVGPFEGAVAKRYAEAGKESLEFAVSKGAKVVEFPIGERVKLAALLPNIAKEWAVDADKKGLPGTKVLKAYMEIMREMGVKPARDWDKE